MSEQTKKHGVLFSAPMMLALLREANPKTQTRRLAGLEEVNEDPDGWSITWQDIEETTGKWAVQFDRPRVSVVARAPWAVYDTIYTKESHALVPDRTARMWRDGADTWPDIVYRASDPNFIDERMRQWWKWRPSIFMREADSRFRARITDVRCQRVQEITDEGIMNEGLFFNGSSWSFFPNDRKAVWSSPRYCWYSLWEGINGKGSFARNPWVFAYTFERIEA